MAKNDKLITRQAVNNVLKAYWEQYKSYPLWTIITLLMPAIGTVCIFFVPPLIIGKIVDMFASNPTGTSLGDVGWLIAGFAGIWLLGEAFWRVGLNFMIKLEAVAMSNLHKMAFKELAARDYDFYSNNFVGTLTKKTHSFARHFESLTDTFSFSIFNNLFPIIFAIVILWKYSIWLPAVLVISLTIVIMVAIPIIKSRAKLVAKRHDAMSKMSGRLSDSITNVLAIKSFAQEDQELRDYGTHVDDALAKWKKAADYQNLRFDVTISPIYVMTNVFGLIAAVFFANALSLSAGTIVIVFSYYSQVTRMFWDVSRVYRNIESSISESAEFTQMLLQPAKIRDADNASELAVTDAAIRFEGAGFAYEKSQDKKVVNDDHDNKDEDEDADEDETADAESAVLPKEAPNMFLKDFNLDIASGQKIGLVGPSGGGKTTITKLILRFIDLSEGRLAIDGQDIKAVTQKSLRDSIAYVPQEPLLFHRSLFDNIAYSNPGATREQVRKAAKLARADEFIDKLPEGYDTLVGERGVKLSGGQRQRIAIARAILKQAPILLLDEATSALDSESEKYIQEGLAELMEGKTAIVIAHRLSTIRHLDRIIVLSNGKIMQDGKHEDLIKKPGLYATLWSHQSGEFLED